MVNVPFDLQATLEARLRTLSSAGQTQTLVRNPRSTVVPPLESQRAGKRARDVLSNLKRDPGALLDLGPLGEGGMGIVRLATQVALDRKVAVKSLRPEHRAPRNVEALLGEAWLAGSLEHPNVVPVHDLGLDEHGVPVLIMKRIEGETWSRLLHDEGAMSKHAPDRDPLEEHLRILMQVCNAVHYAHSRGVVHRDLKPDNVMVGSFGEVYVVDWGIATAPGPSLQMAGTPVYMAPEMLGGEDAELSVRTDVYLLGAVLHEILTGKPPHDGTSSEAMVSSIVLSLPKFSDDVPPELAELARACMRRDPKDRPSSALAVRRALEDFVEHQGSLELATQSEKRLEELLALLEEEEPNVTTLFNVFSECRFGFRQALRGWEKNERARAGLDRAVRAMVRYELERGSAHAAESLLGELLAPDAELERVVRAAAAKEKDQARQLGRLQEMERNLDPRTGGGLRLSVAVAIGIVWTFSPLFGAHVAQRWPQYELVSSTPVSLLSALALLFLGHFVTEGKTPLNLQLVRIVVFAMLVQSVGIVGSYLTFGDLGPRGLTVLCAYWFVIVGMITVSLMPRIWPTAVGYFVAMFATFRWPDHRYDIIAGANGVFCLNAFFMLLGHKKEKRAAARQRA